MARKKKEKKPEEDSEIVEEQPRVSFWQHLKSDTGQTIVAICLIVLSILFAMAGFHKSGIFGEKVYWLFKEVSFGIGFWLIPIALLLLGISLLNSLQRGWGKVKSIGGLLGFIAGLGIISLFDKNCYERAAEQTTETLECNGGTVGEWIATGLNHVFGWEASLLILIALVVIALVLLFHFSWKDITSLFRKKTLDEELSEMEEEEYIDEPESEVVRVAVQSISNKKEEELNKKTSKDIPTDTEVEKFVSPKKKREEFVGVFVPPPIDLLAFDKGKPGTGDMKANALKIQQTLRNFNITVEIAGIVPGPSVTQYALKPAQGIKLTRITALQNDLAMALAAHPLRIEAPIPGKSLVGIEIPNTAKTTVGLGTLLSSADFQTSDKPLLVSLGKGISGKSHFANLAKMPHLLIAGATGSGKSVTVHTIIASLLYRNSPQALKFIMIDPKRVELTLYNGIPHLISPVITNAKKTLTALRWATSEMDRRYDVLENNRVRDIQSYHQNIYEPYAKRQKDNTETLEGENAPEAMPYIVIVVDEMADLMQTYPRELESAIVRLAQMSRAVGIHLILSTQRPSVNVITGLIKANVPSRIALQVASQIDSRTILDMPGAEKLLGQGDMLYLGGEMSQPVRIQSAFISENEVKSIVDYLKDQYADSLNDTMGFDPNQASNENNEEAGVFTGSIDFDKVADEEVDDDKYEEAKQAVISAKKASTSFLQRKLGVGYSRAAKLMDILEEKGVIGPANGSKPREILVESSVQFTADPEPHSATAAELLASGEGENNDEDSSEKE